MHLLGQEWELQWPVTLGEELVHSLGLEWESQLPVTLGEALGRLLGLALVFLFLEVLWVQE